MAESDESENAQDNSLGRLLTLADGVFAIAMTLLALDLKVPSGHLSDARLRQALAKNSADYWSFLVSFYVVANYWKRHRRLMQSVVTFDAKLSRDTISLLLIIAAMPFFADLLGEDGGLPFALALYGAANVVAILLLLLLGRDIRRLQLLDPRAGQDLFQRRDILRTLTVFVLCIPAGYILKGQGPWIFILLTVPVTIPAFLHRRRAPTAPAL
jgi:uncharacterized membrane protein